MEAAVTCCRWRERSSTANNFFIKMVMKTISRMAGGPTDTSRDYEFTDWVALDRFVLDRVRPAQAS